MLLMAQKENSVDHQSQMDSSNLSCPVEQIPINVYNVTATSPPFFLSFLFYYLLIL